MLMLLAQFLILLSFSITCSFSQLSLTTISSVIPNCSEITGICDPELSVLVSLPSGAYLSGQDITIDQIVVDNRIAKLESPIKVTLWTFKGKINYHLKRIGQVNTGPSVVKIPADSACDTQSYNCKNGFCCDCDDSNHTNLCNTLHCIKDSTTWYDVYIEEKTTLNQTAIVEVKMANLTPEKLTLTPYKDDSEKGYMSAKYIIVPEDPIATLSHNTVLLVPEDADTVASINPILIPIEMKSLLLDKSYIDYTGRTCGKIGLTVSTLLRQREKCNEYKHCIVNQIPDMIEVMRLSSALPNATLDGDRDGRVLIRDGIVSSAVQLYLKTADILFLFDDAPAQISDVQSYHTKAQFFKVQVHIFYPRNNSGSYTVGITSCSSRYLQPTNHIKQSVEAFSSYEFHFTVSYRKEIDLQKNYGCSVTIQDTNGLLVAKRRFYLNANGDRNVCIGPCECVRLGGFHTERKCSLMSADEIEHAGFRNQISVPKMSRQINKAQQEEVLTAVALSLTLMFLIGWCKALMGLSHRFSKLNVFGLCLFKKSKHTAPDPWVDEAGEINDEVDYLLEYATRTPDGINSLLKTFIINSLFMFYLPLIPIHYAIVKLHSGFKTSKKAGHRRLGIPLNKRIILTSTGALQPKARKDLTSLEENLSSNNRYGMPEIREDYLEDQIVFGVPEKSGAPVTHSKNYSFDSHIQNVSPTPAILHLHNTSHSIQSSLSNSFASDVEKSTKPNPNNKELAERIRKQSIKQLELWRKVLSTTRTERLLKEEAKPILLSKSHEHNPSYATGCQSQTARDFVKTVSSTHSFDHDDELLHCCVSESLLDSSGRKKLNELLDIETPLYFNNRTPLRGLINCGYMYSLCGRLQCIRPAVYQFDLALHYYQHNEWEDNKLVKLDEPHKLDKDNFIIRLTCTDAIRLVTKSPVFPCLNVQQV